MLLVPTLVPHPWLCECNSQCYKAATGLAGCIPITATLQEERAHRESVFLAVSETQWRKRQQNTCARKGVSESLDINEQKGLTLTSYN